MDKVVLIPSAILSLILVSIYAVRCWRNQKEFNLAVMINSIFQASGIVCGGFLIASIFAHEVRELMTGIDIYIFVGGLAVLAVSLIGFHRDAIKTTASVKTKEDKKSRQRTVNASVD